MRTARVAGVVGSAAVAAGLVGSGVVKVRLGRPPVEENESIRPLPPMSVSARDTAESSSPSPPDSLRLARWHERWTAERTAWHLEKPHPVLQRYEAELLGITSPEERTARCVLFPLCGCSVDLAYLARRGHDVVGVEGVGLALDRLMQDWGKELTVRDERSDQAGLQLRVAQAHWWQKMAAERTGIAQTGTAFVASELLRAMQGDFLKLTPQEAARVGLGQFEPANRATNGTFDAAFDRGSLVAVDVSDRAQYASTLSDLIAPGGRILLVAVEHEPEFGPPHSVTPQQLEELFSPKFDIRLLHRENRLQARGSSTLIPPTAENMLQPPPPPQPHPRSSPPYFHRIPTPFPSPAHPIPAPILVPAPPHPYRRLKAAMR